MSVAYDWSGNDWNSTTRSLSLSEAEGGITDLTLDKIEAILLRVHFIPEMSRAIKGNCSSRSTNLNRKYYINARWRCYWKTWPQVKYWQSQQYIAMDYITNWLISMVSFYKTRHFCQLLTLPSNDTKSSLTALNWQKETNFIKQWKKTHF